MRAGSCPWCCPSAALVLGTRALGEAKRSAELIEDVKIKSNQVKHDNLNKLTARNNTLYLFLYVDNIYIYLYTSEAQGVKYSVCLINHLCLCWISRMHFHTNTASSSITQWAFWSIPTGVSRKDRLIQQRQTNAEWGSLSQCNFLEASKYSQNQLPLTRSSLLPSTPQEKSCTVLSPAENSRVKKKKWKDITTRKTVRNDLLFLFQNTIA